MAVDCYKTIEVTEHPSLTRAVLQTVNVLLLWGYSAGYNLHWGYSLVFTPYLTQKNQQEHGRRKDFF